MRSRIALMTALGGIALVIACSLARRGEIVDPAEDPKHVEPARVATPSRATSLRAPGVPSRVADSPRPVPALARERGEEGSGFWAQLEVLLAPKSGPERLDLRKAVIERTIDYLGWAGPQGLAFSSVSDGVALEIETAWSIREAQIQGLPAELGPEERDESARAIQERYEEVKRTALARIEVMLESSREPERQLRERLEEWFDAVR